jgi:hypothetical protein
MHLVPGVFDAQNFAPYEGMAYRRIEIAQIGEPHSHSAGG